MFKLVSDIDSVKTYENKGYRIEVLDTCRRKVIHIHVADPETHPFYPEITMHSGFFMVSPSIVPDSQIDDAIEGLMTAKELIKELEENKDTL